MLVVALRTMANDSDADDFDMSDDASCLPSQGVTRPMLPNLKRLWLTPSVEAAHAPTHVLCCPRRVVCATADAVGDQHAEEEEEEEEQDEEEGKEHDSDEEAQGRDDEDITELTQRRHENVAALQSNKCVFADAGRNSARMRAF